MTTIAILGATGQIGRSLASSLLERSEFDLNLYARNIEHLSEFISNNRVAKNRVQLLPLKKLGENHQDVIVNAIGAGSRARQLALGAEIFQVSQRYDDFVTDYLRAKPQTLYFFLSSGAVYGFDAKWPVEQDADFSYPVNGSDPIDHYPLSKIVSEAKHRCLSDLKIYDIRIFGFFSQYIDTDDSFFLSEVAHAIAHMEILFTTNKDMVRDYVGGREVGELIKTFVETPPDNGPYDIFSKAPVAKFDLLNRLRSEFDLKFELEFPNQPVELLKNKPLCPSNLTSTADAGYRPMRSSMEIVVEELHSIFAN